MLSSLILSLFYSVLLLLLLLVFQPVEALGYPARRVRVEGLISHTMSIAVKILGFHNLWARENRVRFDHGGSSNLELAYEHMLNLPVYILEVGANTKFA